MGRPRHRYNAGEYHAMPHFQRSDRIDTLRGLAVVWMTVFHFCFDLSHFGFTRQDFYNDPFWTWQRTAIVSLFLFCAGLGQALALDAGQGWRRFWRRWAQVAGCALLVSIGSWWMFPQSFIYFGVLHGLAVMLVVARLTAGAGRWLWPLGALAIVSPWVAQALLDGLPLLAQVFDDRPLNVLGWVTRKPITEDYVPVFPWLGVLWWGLATGRELLRLRPRWLSSPAPGPRALAPLAWLGRHSLPWYMLHQPVLLGTLALFALLLRHG
jgi:uncharacterized membrane protein